MAIYIWRRLVETLAAPANDEKITAAPAFANRANVARREFRQL